MHAAPEHGTLTGSEGQAASEAITSSHLDYVIFIEVEENEKEVEKKD